MPTFTCKVSPKAWDAYFHRDTYPQAKSQYLHGMPSFYVGMSIVASPNKTQNFAIKKVSNTGLKSSLRAIERYAYCLGYLYFTPRYGFPKSNGTIPTFYNKIQWRGWHRVISFNGQVHTTPHPVLNFLGMYMSPVQWYPSLFFFWVQQLTAVLSVHIMV